MVRMSTLSGLHDLFSGVLYKCGGKVKSWTKRFFILKSDYCLYYYKDTSKGPLGTISLHDPKFKVRKGEAADISWPKAAKADCRMAVVTTLRTYFMYCEYAHEIDEWVELLNKAAKKANEKTRSGNKLFGAGRSASSSEVAITVEEEKSGETSPRPLSTNDIEPLSYEECGPAAPGNSNNDNTPPNDNIESVYALATEVQGEYIDMATSSPVGSDLEASAMYEVIPAAEPSQDIYEFIPEVVQNYGASTPEQNDPLEVPPLPGRESNAPPLPDRNDAPPLPDRGGDSPPLPDRGDSSPLPDSNDFSPLPDREGDGHPLPDREGDGPPLPNSELPLLPEKVDLPSPDKDVQLHDVPEGEVPPLPDKEDLPPLPDKEETPPLPDKEDLPPLPDKEDLPPLPDKEETPPLPDKEVCPPLSDKVDTSNQEVGPPVPVREVGPPVPVRGESLNNIVPSLFVGEDKDTPTSSLQTLELASESPPIPAARASPHGSPKMSPRTSHSTHSTPQNSPLTAKRGAPQISPQLSPRHSPQPSPRHSPQPSPRHSPQPSPRRSTPQNPVITRQPVPRSQRSEVTGQAYPVCSSPSRSEKENTKPLAQPRPSATGDPLAETTEPMSGTGYPVPSPRDSGTGYPVPSPRDSGTGYPVPSPRDSSGVPVPRPRTNTNPSKCCL